MTEPVSKAHRTAFVAIIGRPSAGKSTFLNTVCGHKVSIISTVPQTTRNRIRGIVNVPESAPDGPEHPAGAPGQLVFIDTPGFHDSDKRFNQHMRGLIEETIRDAEIVLYILDPTRPIGEEEQRLAATVAGHSATVPVVVAVNKTDIADADKVISVVAWARETVPDARIFRLSAETGDGTEELLHALVELAPEGDPVYPEDHYTDQPPEFRVAEIIREKAINRTSQEVPHSLYVDVADMEIRESDDEREDTLWIRAFLLVERESQKGILVGKGGEKIKRIRQSAQAEIAALFPYRIHLDLRVKVDPKWRRKDDLLKRLVN